MATLKVSNKPNTQKITINKAKNTPIVPTYNPQVAAPVPKATPTFNPQPAARLPVQGTGSSNFSNVTPDQIIAEAARQADIARIAAVEQTKQLHTLKEAAISAKQKGIAADISRKIGISGFTYGRASRERAVGLLNRNNNEAALYIQAKQRQFERDKAAKQKALIYNQDNPNWQQMLDEANAWADAQAKSVDTLAKNYGKNQKDLFKFAGSKVKGKAAKIFGTGYDVLQKSVLTPVSKAWDAFTWTASQPGRAVNTAINYVNPNRVRTYYGGGEAKGGINVDSIIKQLKSSYNASANQRIIGRTKADEAARLKDFYKSVKLKDGRTVKVHKGGGKFFTKYGDDISNLVADPINALPVNWAAKLGKASKLNKAANPLLKLLGKSSLGREAAFRVGLSGDTGVGKFVKYLRSAADSTKRDRFFADNRKLLDERKVLIQEISAHSDAWRKQKFAGTNELNKRLGGLSPESSDLLQRYMLNKNFGGAKFPDTVKAPHSWDGLALPRGFNKQKRQEIEDLARFIKQHTDTLHARDIRLARGSPALLRQTYAAYKKGYLPQYKPKGLIGSGKGVGGMPYYLKHKTNQTLQTRDELLHNLRTRTYGTLGQGNRSKAWLKLNRESHSKKISALDRVLTVRAHGGDYKLNKLDKAGNFNRKTKPYRPLSLWRKSVLLARPAWYVNNALWNIPAAISAGGAKAIPEMAKMAFSKKYRAKTAEMTAPIRSHIGNEVGSRGLGRFARAVEDIPRSAAYKALLDRGKEPSFAAKRTNDWLFDYSNKRWEQPIRTVLPFYNWTKGLTKLVLTMPFKYPRHANFYSKLYQQFYQNPQSKLDSTTKTWTDEKGQVHTYSEQAKYKGKVKVYTDKSGKEHWSNTPFNPLTPEQLGQINMNPLLVLGKLLSSSRDRYGNMTTDRSVVALSGEQFPQASLWQKFSKRNDPNFERWFSKSGYSKESQGQDTGASNYSAGLDNNSKFWKGLDSFLGKPGTIVRDPKAAAYNKRYTAFNTAYFSVDWDKRIKDLQASDPTTAYDIWNAEKDALAKKYGFDFKKDIVHGGWQKYDTDTSKRTKALKEKAAVFMDSYWKEYAKLPKPVFVATAKGGYWTPSTARPYWIDKFKQWRNQDTFAENAYLKLPYYNEKDAAGNKTGKKNYINPYQLQVDEAASQSRQSAGLARLAEGKRKYALWQKYFALGSMSEKQDFLKAHPELLVGKVKKQSPFQYEGKFFKTVDSMNRYIEGNARHTGKALPADFKKSDKQIRFEFFQKYFAATKAERLKLMADNPQFNSYGDPSQIGFDAFRANKTSLGRLAGRKLPGLSTLEAKILADIRAKVSTRNPTKRGKKIAFKTR